MSFQTFWNSPHFPNLEDLAMVKTRGVFALITRDKVLLLSERMDGKGWNLPGGRVEESESDQVALVREVREETGLNVKVLHQVGPDHVFNDDTAVAYACKIVGGQLAVTAEAKNHAWVNAQEVRQGHFYNPEYDEMGNRTFENEQRFEVKLVGPEGRLGRTGRMVWDAYTLMEEPIKGSLGVNAEKLPPDTIVCVHDCFFKRIDDRDYWCWRRLDPHTPSGKMEIK